MYLFVTGPGRWAEMGMGGTNITQTWGQQETTLQTLLSFISLFFYHPSSCLLRHWPSAENRYSEIIVSFLTGKILMDQIIPVLSLKDGDKEIWLQGHYYYDRGLKKYYSPIPWHGSFLSALFYNWGLSLCILFVLADEMSDDLKTYGPWLHLLQHHNPTFWRNTGSLPCAASF